MSRMRRGGFWGRLVFLVGLLLLWSLFKGFLDLRKAYRRVEEAREIFELEEVRHGELVKKLEKVQKDEYVEKVIRDELNMQREGEVVVVLQDDNELQIINDESQNKEEKRNWEKWLDLVR